MRRLFSLSLLTLALLLTAQPADAQIWDRVKKAAQRGAERAVERETTRRADRAVTAAFGLAEDAVVCAVTDERCIEQAQADGQDVVVVDQNGDPLPASQQPSVQAKATAGGQAAPTAPGEGVWANYDFVPGQRVLFYEDYSGDRVGNFPQRLEFVRGNWEIVEWQGRRLLRNTGPRHSAIRIVLPEVLPERFTIETEVYFPHTNQRFVLLTQPPQGNWNQVDHNYIHIGGAHGTGVDATRSTGLSTSLNDDRRIHEGLIPIRIIVDGEYVKTYVGENRTSNIPNAVLPRSEALHLENIYFASEEEPMYLGPIRIAASETSLYDALMADGRVATQGIFFDTGSATIRPESSPTLKEIARALQEHGDLRLRIEGHTDNTGSADANQQLSERRAAAVRDHLVQREGIAASRLESAGLGQSAPAADNATPEGRQTNRRVELVVL